MNILSIEGFKKWLADLKFRFPGVHSKFESYCLNECPWRKCHGGRRVPCPYDQERCSCNGMSFVACHYYCGRVMNNQDSAYLSSFSSSNFWSQKSRKEEHSAKQQKAEQKKNPAPAAPPISRSISQEYLYYKHRGVDVNQKINIDQSSHTGMAINEGRYVFVNGRMVSREDLRNENE